MNELLQNKTYFLAIVILVIVVISWLMMYYVEREVNMTIDKKFAKILFLLNNPNSLNSQEIERMSCVSPSVCQNGDQNPVIAKYTTTQNVQYQQPDYNSKDIYQVHDEYDYISPLNSGRIYNSPLAYQYAQDTLNRPPQPKGSRAFTKNRFFTQNDDTPFYDMSDKAHLDTSNASMKAVGSYNTPSDADKIVKECIHGTYKKTGCYECSVRTCTFGCNS